MRSKRVRPGAAASRHTLAPQQETNSGCQFPLPRSGLAAPITRALLLAVAPEVVEVSGRRFPIKSGFHELLSVHPTASKMRCIPPSQYVSSNMQDAFTPIVRVRTVPPTGDIAALVSQ